MMLPLVIAVMPEGADRDYMEWLFVEHHRLMMVTAFGIVPQSADADEIVSDSLIALYKKIDKLRGMEKNALRLYIVSTVRNTSLNYLKKHQRMNSPFLHMPDAVICQIPGRDNTEGKIVLSEELDRVRMAIRELPERECMAIQLKFDLDRTDAEIAQLMGISVDRTITLTFAIGSALAAFASMFYGMTYVYIKPTTGAMPGIKAFTAAVFGGIGSIPGAMLGGILLGLIEQMSKTYISTLWADAIVFAVLVVVLVVKPTGLLGKPMQEKV